MNQPTNPDRTNRTKVTDAAAAAWDHGHDKPLNQRWLPWPNQHLLAPRSRNVYCYRINAAVQGFPPGLEAKVVDHQLYFRWVGDQPGAAA